MVPLYILPPFGGGRGNTHETVSQLQMAPTMLTLLGLPVPATMKASPLVWKSPGHVAG
jgi:bisphosphoglycerate-independent phosphoglycerate mutase (AlkP superfamily)